MSRDIPFDENAICDGCGKKGAYDFMGDLICAECFSTPEGDAMGELISELSTLNATKLEGEL